jgi:hypothetical protein
MGTHKNWSHLTKEYLEDLHKQFGNWADVRRHLDIPHPTLMDIRKRLGMALWQYPDRDRRKWRGSRLDPLRDQIVEMAASGNNCAEIARTIGEEDPEIVRDYLSKLGIDRQKAGARSGEKNPMWNGGRTIDEDGYVLVKASAGHPFVDRHGYVRLHRLAMEQKLGRYLLPEEVVHHLDGDPQNNDIENLELFDNNGDHLQREWSDPEWAEHQRAIRLGVPSKRGSRRVSENGAPGW